MGCLLSINNEMGFHLSILECLLILNNGMFTICQQWEAINNGMLNGMVYGMFTNSINNGMGFHLSKMRCLPSVNNGMFTNSINNEMGFHLSTGDSDFATLHRISPQKMPQWILMKFEIPESQPGECSLNLWKANFASQNLTHPEN